MAGSCDFLIVGAGIAGASVGFALTAQAPRARIVMVERESAPGYHSTGRSAALFVETYGNAVVRALARGSRPFLETPPVGFADHPLLSPRGVLHYGRPDQRGRIESLFEDCRSFTRDLRLLEAADIARLQPALRPDRAAVGVHEPHAMDIDVAALHQGFLRGFKAMGGELRTDAEVLRIERRGSRWAVATADGPLGATILVDAAGAWADTVAAAAGLSPLGLVPKRRTAITFDAPGGTALGQWPMSIEVDETLYFKPEAGRILVSPCDETPVPPSDAQPEELDVAIAVARIEEATTLSVRAITHKWAGLRSFFPDKLPAVGFDPVESGFFWLAGQGGYGIKSSSAMGRLAAALLAGADIPADLAELGISAAAIAPDRFKAGAAATATPSP
ncbi:MAG: NAD(P)/FAD-dependent oxidoreductase [Rhodospirillales bacterium]